MSYDAYRTNCEGYWANQEPDDEAGRQEFLNWLAAEARAETARLVRLAMPLDDIQGLVVMNKEDDIKQATEWGMRQGLRDVAVEAEETLVRR